MKAKWIKKLLCLFLCIGMATAAMAQSNRPSILDRVQNESDPELGELIRAAIENKTKEHRLSPEETLELIRKVSISYTQIKLFDQQMTEVSRRLEEVSGPAELRYELLLAKTELKAKLMTEVANLRELMGIIPRHAFEKQQLEKLNTWLALNVIGERVYVLDARKPFQEYWAERRYNPTGLLSNRETLDYIHKRFKSRSSLPIRIDIYHTSETSSAAKELSKKIISLAIETNSQMETEVRTELSTWVGSGVSTFFIREGKLSALYPGGAQLKRPDGGSKPIVTGIFEPNDLDQHILWRLTKPKNVPLTFRIEYDETSTAIARQTADKISAIIKDFGIGELVETERSMVETVPENTFLGRWQAITKGDVKTIEIQPTGACVFVKSPGSKIKGGPNVPGRWFLTPKEIFMDIKDQREWYNVYRGSIDKKGNLVVDRGEIYPQGSFHVQSEKHPMVFKKVY